MMTDTFSEHRPRLFGIAYRMLGSVTEAEDMVQEACLRWQRQDPSLISSPGAWLVTAVTRLCIDRLRLARRRREEYYGVWLPEPLVELSAPSPDESATLADSLGMAFMLMLERLSPLERAALLLREVFGYEYVEIAEITGRSEANCRKIVSRARSGLSGAAEPFPEPDSRARGIVRQFLHASSTGEVGPLLALLTEDAVLYSDGGGKVIAAGRPVRGADRISRFLAGIARKSAQAPDYRPARINGRAGALGFNGGRITSVVSFDFRDGRISGIHIVRNPDKMRHPALCASLGLPFPEGSSRRGRRSAGDASSEGDA